ncbi:ankyrin repeat, SAM and basic leucine zipper domain-containing protein 1 [Ranitomeya imitator]|uniref:ankyrin repeat, SAM and basic leucine zipper domain-containing protein 1 n=1 Tax=Ranitomeya imitator TaxID=111125 RepID=UPI0037E7EDCF
MAACSYHAVPGGGESSDSDDLWDLDDHVDVSKTLNTTLVTDSNEDSLKNALTTGNVKLVESLLDSGIHVDCSLRYGWTPLMYAAAAGNLAIVRLLLDKGANANFERDTFTVLMAACTANASEEHIVKCVEFLLSRNVSPNVCCRKKMTPVMHAARGGLTQVVTLLVAHGAAINAQDENGFTGLIWAAHSGHKNTVLKLLELGADIRLSTKTGNTAADIARENNHLEIFSILSFSGNLNTGNSNFNKEEAMCRYLRVQPEPSSYRNAEMSAEMWKYPQHFCNALPRVIRAMHPLEQKPRRAPLRNGRTPGAIRRDLVPNGLEESLLSSRPSADYWVVTLLDPRYKDNLPSLIPLLEREYNSAQAPGNVELMTFYCFSYSPSSDLDVFLHGLGLEHLAELLKENDLTLRQLLYLEESELKKAGITDVKDCKKIMAAMKEIHVEDTKLGKLPSLSKLESSDELFAFLLRLNRQCNAISHAVVAVSGQIPSNPQKVVFEWDNSQNFTTVCEDILTSITELNKEVCGLQDRLTKFQHDQKNNLCRVLPLEEEKSWSWWKYSRMNLVAFFGFGIMISIFHIVVKHKNTH